MIHALTETDACITETVHYPGDTRHLHFGPGKYIMHSVENIGDTDLVLATVEFWTGPMQRCLRPTAFTSGVPPEVDRLDRREVV